MKTKPKQEQPYLIRSIERDQGVEI